VCARADGEPQEGEGKLTEGTGLGDGDTRGAKDITEQLEDQDQMLGAQQKGEQPEREEEAQAPERPEDQTKGAEMDEDFEGALEDVQPDANEDDGEHAESCTFLTRRCVVLRPGLQSIWANKSPSSKPGSG
jgi:midasin